MLEIVCKELLTINKTKTIKTSPTFFLNKQCCMLCYGTIGRLLNKSHIYVTLIV